MVSDPQNGAEALLHHLEGEVCPWCEEGDLERDTYKETPSLVCEACDTPVVRNL